MDDRLSSSDVAALTATGEPVAVDEVTEVYRPLAQLLSLRAAAARDLQHRTDEFLGDDRAAAPFVIGIGGSVAVGKSTTARLLQALLSRGPGRPGVDLLTTDGFLYPNAVLEARGLMTRKGFPESYDQRKLVDALAAIKAGQPEVETPVYSHQTYDIVPGRCQVIRHPELVIVEGLNVLQVDTKDVHPTRWWSRTSSTSPSTSMRPRMTSPGGSASGSRVCGPPCCRTRTRSSTTSRRCPTRRWLRRPNDLVRDQPGQPAREHRTDPRPSARGLGEGPYP